MRLFRSYQRLHATSPCCWSFVCLLGCSLNRPWRPQKTKKKLRAISKKRAAQRHLSININNFCRGPVQKGTHMNWSVGSRAPEWKKPRDDSPFHASTSNWVRNYGSKISVTHGKAWSTSPSFCHKSFLKVSGGSRWHYHTSKFQKSSSRKGQRKKLHTNRRHLAQNIMANQKSGLEKKSRRSWRIVFDSWTSRL